MLNIAHTNTQRAEYMVLLLAEQLPQSPLLLWARQSQCRLPHVSGRGLASAAAALDAVVLAMLLIVVKPTPNLEIFVLSVLRNSTRLAHGQTSFSFGTALSFTWGPFMSKCPTADGHC